MKKQIRGLIPFVAILSLVMVFETHAQVCETQSGTAIGYRGGDASTLSTLDGISNDAANMFLRLKGKGANFQSTGNYPVSSNYRLTCAAADFNNDGFVDLIEGGQVCDTAPSGYSGQGNTNANDSNLSFFISRGAQGGGTYRFLFDGPYYILYAGSALDACYQMIALGAGDFDGDGDQDFAVISWSGKLWIFKNLFKENNIAVGGVPVFAAPVLVENVINDGYNEWEPSGDPHHRWTSNIAVLDFDKDGDLDLILGIPTESAQSRYGEVVVYLNNGHGVFSRLKWKNNINPYTGTGSGSEGQEGVTGVAAADFDGDGAIDIWVGSSSSRNVYYYQGDGALGFKKVNTMSFTTDVSHGSVSSLGAGDLNQDGLPDFVLSTDGAHGTNTPGGFVYWYQNKGIISKVLTFTRNCLPSTCAATSTSGDLDALAIGDFDNDGDFDFTVADGNDSHNTYFFMNDVYPLYVSQGTVVSKNLVPCAFITSDNAIVSATITVSQSKPTGTTITYYLSDSDDANGAPLWEGPVTPGVEFTFASPGLFVRWKAVFTTSVETVTPKVNSVDISYKYITKREYSRTSQALAQAEVNSSHTDLETVLYSASFEFPSWDGHLRSYDVTNLSLEGTRNSQLANIKSVGATYVADAGELLAARSYTSRTVYTAYDEEDDGIMNNRTDFTVSNATLLGDYLNLGVGSTEIVPLIEFVLGNDRAWKLGDINHSSPQVEAPPAGVSSLMGDDAAQAQIYEDFKTANANRQTVVLVGANDGMLHCFDPATLVELWAFIPNNLLYKLRTMRIKDPDCGEYVTHQYFVDSTPVIQDVYFSGNWHTIVMCGQGAGWGRDHSFYYFCLDVTNPLDPKPMWEVTDDTMGETWSVPIIGKVSLNGATSWVAFMGSGYDTWDSTTDSGDYFYGVDIATGEILKSIQAKSSPQPTSPFGITNTIPGSVNLADRNKDGVADYAYFGDLLGRMWRVDLTEGTANQWKADVVYTDPYNHPIITKPAIYVGSDGTIHLYFGTGGDDKAPSTDYYAFIALADSISSATIEWFLGSNDLATKPGFNINQKKGEFEQGEKVWADDVIADQRVYIATLKGNIESLNPCLTLGGSGRIYSRYIQGSQAGGSALLGTDGSTIEYLQTAQKVRSAVTVGSIQKINSGEGSISKRLVFIQSYTQSDNGAAEPPSEVLAQTVTGNKVVIKSWREVYRK